MFNVPFSATPGEEELGLLTALWREGAVEQVEAPVSQRFIRVEVEGERRGVDPLPAAVRHWVAQPSKSGQKRLMKYNFTF